MSAASVSEAPVLVWIDLEMTGLDPERDVILQAALSVTGPLPAPEVEVRDWVLHAADDQLARMDEYVRAMHTRTGLIERVRASALGPEEVEAAMLEVISSACPPRTGVLAGNSVWVDRIFLRRHLPAVEAYLHYRQVDVSSLKVMAAAWFGERGVFAKPEGHEAAGDLRASMAELNFYRALFGG